MAVQKPLVIISGQIQQIATGDTVDPAKLGTGTPDGTKFLRDDGTWQPGGGGGTTLNNVISSPTTVPTDTSYPVVSYLTIVDGLTINGNLMVIG